MSFNFNHFIKKAHKKFESEFQIKEVEEILSLDEDYLKDSPLSTGKRLIIDRLIFCGRKPESVGGEFSFSHQFTEGVNLLIASNLKGKSSVFKIIKFALTGKKPKNVISWIKNILLIFRINDTSYSIYLDLSRGNLKAKLINGKAESYQQAENLECVWNTKSIDDFESQMKDFFFNQFSYYSLKWTQKDSRKSAIGLNESDASWGTYFSSIYLESKESNVLIFGAQETKVFEMLMGLELTYPINRLKIRLDKMQAKQAMQEAQIQHKKKTVEESRKTIQEQLEQTQKEYDKLVEEQKKPIEIIDSSALYSEYDRLTNILNNENSRILKAQEKLNALKKQEYSLLEELRKNENSITNLLKEKSLKEKRIIELSEYLSTKIFFSNLNIQHCPNCNHSVSKERKDIQTKEHSCSLCSETMTPTEVIDSKENINSKINELQKLIPQYDIKTKAIEELAIKKQEMLLTCQSQINQINIEPSFNLIEIKENIRSIEDKINEAQKNIQPPISDEKVITLIKEIGKLEDRFSSLKSDKDEQVIDYSSQINLLEYAINELKLQRHDTGNDLIDKLKKIMLSEVQRFGLQNISEITISENMEIRYKQFGETKKFEDFVEGEQLRLKIAFYLSLIQLDVLENFGRHTRFLIIDSPTKEEADDEYLGGLVSELQTINEQFKDKLQILIGTANRSFENQFENQLIIPKGQYVF